jgi:hypothetical protein
MEPQQLSPRYKWRKTWPDEADRDSWKTDFQGWDGDIPVGRVRYEENGPKKGLWQWSGDGPPLCQRFLPHQGYEGDPRVAALRAEDYYNRLVAYNGLDDSAGDAIL